LKMGRSAIEQDDQMVVFCPLCAANIRIMKNWGNCLKWTEPWNIDLTAVATVHIGKSRK